MAKRHRNNLITASFHYLVKTTRNDLDPENPIEGPFTVTEFQRIVSRISDKNPLDESDPAVITRIKSGEDLPFSGHEEVNEGLHFGNFDGAYYGQQYRNNLLGVISADSLNLRPFYYLITRLRDGRILVGATYHGQFGDYEGLRRCLAYLLRGSNYRIISRSITSVTDEIGDGVPTELRLTYWNANNRPERRGIFSKTGVIAIKNTEFGDGFQEEVKKIANNARGDERARRRAIASVVSQGDRITLDDDDILGCSAIVRTHGRTTTIYFLGGNNMATKYRLNVDVNGAGVPDRNQVRDEMVRIMRQRIMQLLA